MAQRSGIAPALVSALLLATGCSQGSKRTTIRVDGSSTVLPLNEAMADELHTGQTQLRITIGVSGTGGGFRKFCSGDTALSAASRPILPTEERQCGKNGIRFVELPVAYDGIAVVANAKNPFLKSLSVQQLRKLWEPAAQGSVTHWDQVDPAFPHKEIHLYGPGVDSGTYDYFTRVVVGKVRSSRGDYTSSENDHVLLRGVAGDPWALGYFSYAYYRQNARGLKLVPIAASQGQPAVLPSEQTIRDRSYQPLTRPLFLYASEKGLKIPGVRKFVHHFYKHPQTISKTGFVPLEKGAIPLAEGRLSPPSFGTLFHEHRPTSGPNFIKLLSADAG